MLSGIVFASYGFYNPRRICFVSKILATFVSVIYAPDTRVSKFQKALLCTASALVFPQILARKRELFSFLASHIHILKGYAEV